MFYQSGLVYISHRENGKIDPKTKTPFFELFYADTDRNGNPLKGEPFSIEINSNEHEGPVSFSKDGNSIFFTRNNLKNGVTKADRNNRIQMKIYQATRGQYDWENVTELPFNSDEYTCFHPTLSLDGKKLYFASDMPGGLGGFDIWVSEKQGDTWSKPINLGDKINTEKRESFPYIHESNQLFFSSDGQKDNNGGLDIYVADLSSGENAPVKNLGYPYNTNFDDLGFILNAEGTRGYFSSNRSGGFGSDDIYVFDVKDGITGTSMPLTGLFKVLDASNRSPLEGASIRLLESTGAGLTSEGDLYDVVLSPSSEGSNEIALKLVRKKDAAQSKPNALSDENGEAEIPIRSNRDYIVLVNLPGYEPEEVSLTTFGKKESPVTTHILMKKKTCADVKGVVRMARYGTTVANANIKITNSCDNSVIMAKTNPDGEFRACLKAGCDYTIKAEKEGYEPSKPQNLSKFTDDYTKEYDIKLDLTPLGGGKGSSSVVPAGTVIVLENIYYDFGKWNIRAGAALELDALSVLLKRYPSMEIELSSHTDSRGSSESNLELSNKRAEAAQRYLIARGIEAKRIRPVGYGEANPRNKCKDGVECTEDEHQYNRRTEVKILKIDDPVTIRYGEKGPEVIDKKKN